MSTNVYDTAWVSMIAKEENGQKRWLFPEAFSFVLDSQCVRGNWDDEGPATNAILCTMAALLALLEHQKHVHYGGCPPLPRNITVRISKAVTWLEDTFSRWGDDHVIDSVALEILVPAHLRRLENKGISFTSPLLQVLNDMSEHRFPKSKVEALYTRQQTTLFHSLEGLGERIDFDKLRHHKTRGSMLGSPSSTAAYLMHVRDWDQEAEMYLRNVFKYGQGKSNGSFPSAAPIDLFEISWVLSTLLDGGIPVETLGRENALSLASHLAQRLRASGESIGFSAGMLPDVDDTAKCLHTLAFFDDYRVDASSMISQFWSSTSFKTYQKESTGSISANCNVLKALLAMQTPTRFAPQILAAASFICDSWTNNVRPRDKWNVAWEYCAMLSAQALSRLLELSDSESFHSLPFELKGFKIQITLSRIAWQLLHSQALDGSFGNGCDEVTAYAILALVALTSSYAGLSGVEKELSVAIKAASNFLQVHVGQWEPRRIWIEKVTYSSDLLTRAYCLTALHQSVEHDGRPRPETAVENKEGIELCGLFRSVPLFVHAERGDPMLRLALVESQPFLVHLEQNRFDVFPEPPKVNEKYLRVIPFAWTACNYLTGSPLPATTLMDMMKISLLNYQADEYIEMLIPHCKPHEVIMIRRKLDELLEEPLETTSEPDSRPSKRHCSDNDERHGKSHRSINTILTTFLIYIDRVLNCPHVREAARSHRELVRREIIGYLQAQISTVGARSRLGQDGNQSSFFDWIHTSGARDTSCPFSFAYYLCLVIYASDANVSTTTSKPMALKKRTTISFEADYLLKDVCGSLSRICRMYNDYGSVRRDQEEGNLNSVDFFFEYQNEVTGGHESLLKEEAKGALRLLADLERNHMDHSFERLRELVPPKLLEALQVFVHVTDLFGQIYVARDIGTRTKVS
ncbi:hypothetical protein K504DRAFT_390797 [Pleomassaria siparia CBS 279.74]|uniref:Ent-kaurene synthase n=1 Tax=Pleomassaria siparia CBS 279.74 TaxID=1314801 RepID=A0A6G1JUZ2_9PLEO|nr:hypothetical protein K504DRAFT_390797 [Pleomassaria siparia CBS 279.74]